VHGPDLFCPVRPIHFSPWLGLFKHVDFLPSPIWPIDFSAILAHLHAGIAGLALALLTLLTLH